MAILYLNDVVEEMMQLSKADEKNILTDKKTVDKIKKLVKSIERDGLMKGEGKPEKLKSRINTYSRRIDEKNRLIYIAGEGNVTIKSFNGHYEDD